MTIALNNPITREDIIDRIHSRIKDYVASQTEWVSSTVIISARNLTLGTITQNSSTGGGTNVGGPYPGNYPAGPVSRVTYSTKDPDPIGITEFSSEIGASQTTVGHVMEVLKNLMHVYANSHRFNLRNTGNLTVGGSRTSFNLVTHTGSARLDGAPSSVRTSITNDLTNAAVTRNIATGSQITATNLDSLIEDCRTIWKNRCDTTSLEDFMYSYCHSSCHGNHGSHGSRGRR